eukprot:RCo011480
MKKLSKCLLVWTRRFPGRPLSTTWSSSSPTRRAALTALGFSAFGTAAYFGWTAFRPLDGQCRDEKKELATKAAAGAEGMVQCGELPIVNAVLVEPPFVPPPITRTHPVRLIVDLETTVDTLPVSGRHQYPFWTFNKTVPGPLIRAMVGDVVEIRYSNKASDGLGHNIDFHSVTGPGGGSAVTFAEAGETKIATFKMLYPGLFIYHCSAAPLPTHIQNGMYGCMLVEPPGGLPPVNKEYYVVQSEIYAEPALDTEEQEKGMLEPSYRKGLAEDPMYVVFNGREGALTEKTPLQCKQGDRVRMFFGNAGPNLISSFHIIGTILDKVYREADLLSPPARAVQTTTVPAGGATVVEMDAIVPGNYTLIDHSVFRVDKGCVGFLKVSGQNPRKEIYDSRDRPTPCPGCKLHN